MGSTTVRTIRQRQQIRRRDGKGGKLDKREGVSQGLWERKGKERKGKERKGKERKRKDLP